MQLADTLIPILVLVRQTAATDAAASEAAAPHAAASHATATKAVAASAAAPAARAGGSPFAPIPLSSLELETRGTADTDRRQAAADTRGVTTAAPRRSVGAEPAAALAARLAVMIDDASAAALANGSLQANFDAALFAVLAWADETLLAGRWAGAPAWPQHLLQRQYFNSTTAGVVFFTRLDDLHPEQQEVREVYALCLALGFRGRFAYERAPRALEEKRRATIQQVLADGGLPAAAGQVLFPDAYKGHALGDAAGDSGAPLAQRSPYKPSRQTVFMFGLPLLVLVALYGTYHLIVAQMVNAITPLIK